MKISKNINYFLDTICNKIKYFPIRENIKSELYDHIIQEKEKYIQEGLNSEEAEKRAIENMGPPEEISNDFNKIYKRKLDWKLLIILIAFVGINMILTICVASNKNGDIQYVIRNISYMIIGAAISLGIYFLNYQKIQKFSIRYWNNRNVYYNYKYIYA